MKNWCSSDLTRVLVCIPNLDSTQNVPDSIAALLVIKEALKFILFCSRSIIILQKNESRLNVVIIDRLLRRTAIKREKAFPAT